jgi:type IV pilus assembly protein PilM
LFGGGKKVSACPIGIDLGGRTIRMMQLARDGDKVFAVAAASRLLPFEVLDDRGQAYHAAVSHAVRDMLASGQFQERRAVSCLPASALQYKNIRLPRMPRDELASAVQWEASERLKLSADAMSMQFFDAGEVQQGQDTRQEIILMAAPKRFVEDHAKSLTGCDLELSAIDAVPGALARCIGVPGSGDGQDAKVRVVIDVGYNGTKVLITRGERICFFKLIEIGGRAFDEAVALQLQIPVPAAAETRQSWLTGSDPAGIDGRITGALVPAVTELAREVGLCMRYYGVTFRGRRPEEVTLVGGESSNAWLWARLCEEAALSPSPDDPLARLDLTRVSDLIGGPEKSAAWTVAAGLSLKPLDTGRKQKSRGAA